MPKRKKPGGSGAIKAQGSRAKKYEAVPPQVPAGGPRALLPDFNSLEKLVRALETSKHILVLTGAGIR